MGEAGSRRVRRSWRGTSQTWVVQGTPQITGTLKALNHNGQVAGSKDVGRIQGYREEIPASGITTRTGLGPSKRRQAAHCEVLLIDDRPLSHGPIPRVDGEIYC